MDQVVTRVVPLVLLLMGLSYLLAAEHWVRFARERLEAPHRFLLAALGMVTAGLIIVVTHNWWRPSPGVVVTIFGWVLVLKGAAFLLFPSMIGELTEGWSEGAMKSAVRAGGLLATILGAVLTWATWVAA